MLRFLAALVLMLGSAGCSGSVTGQAAQMRLALMSPAELWLLQRTTTSAAQLLQVEAELYGRGMTAYGGVYLGQRSAAHVGQVRFGRVARARAMNTHNCSDFPTSHAAQRFFLAAGGPTRDPHDLDRDGDGFACEWGVKTQAIARRARVNVTPRRRYRASYTCHTGPRGGRFAWVNGRKDYSKC